MGGEAVSALPVEYPPQPIVHDAQAAARRGITGEAMTSDQAVRAYPFAFTSLRGGWATSRVQPVVVEAVRYPEHEYQPSMIWPANAARSLCMVCRSTHPKEGS
jgi:hypothetical protein